MKRYRALTICFALAVTVIFAVTLNAFAGHGYGKGGSSYDHKKHPHGCMAADLTPEQQEAATAERQAFKEDTADLRQQMYEKHAELMSVLAKAQPDEDIAKELITELSNAKTQFNLKWLDHFIRMKKISPELGMGFHGKGCMGGYHHGYMHGMGGEPKGGPHWK